MASIASTKSAESIESIGMDAMHPRHDPRGLPRLLAEGVVPINLSIFDCVVFFLYCPTHNAIALRKGSAIWFPFVAIPESVTWEQAAKDGLTWILSKRDEELDPKLQVGKLPNFDTSTLHVIRVQLADRFFVRYTQVVSVARTPGFECCNSSGVLTWVPVDDVLANKVDNVWGPEVILFTQLCLNPEQNFVHEYSLDTALKFVLDSSSFRSKLLAEAKIEAELVKMLFEDFVDHCFPSFYMTIKSFETYLVKYGFNADDRRIPKLFKSAARTYGYYMDFHEFLFAIVGLEPDHRQFGVHHRVIFQYYDRDQDSKLSESEFQELLHDLHPYADQKMLEEYMSEIQKTLKFKSEKLGFTNFSEAFAENSAKPLKELDILCLSPKPLMTQIKGSARLRAEQRANFSKYNLHSVRRNRGPCATCRAQNYNYNLHSIFFDANGRCMRPMQLDNVTFNSEDKKMTSHRYSAEYVFKSNSTCNTFLDVIRNLYTKGDIFVYNDPTERSNFLASIQSMCDHMNSFLVSEPKFNRITAPAIVVGSILGNLDILLKMEQCLWRGAPVLPETIVFLGNYFGPTKYNVEVICYLFSLKMIAPNKVFLLRGSSELRDMNQNDLMPECFNKYGKDVGTKIWELLNDVFDKLPFAMLVDESILCVHSGLPKTALRVGDLLKIPPVVKNVEKESPVAFELLYNTPKIFTSLTSDAATSGDERIFCEGTFNAFMKLNELHFMIRGHDICPEGGLFYFDGRCITVCSTDTNESKPAVIFIDRTNSMIRFVSLVSSDK